MASPVQVLMDIGALSKEDYERWRFGKVDYLERICKMNLGRLSFVMSEVRVFARKNSLKPSWTFYKRFGRKGKPAIQLRFSKSGQEDIETAYATHYISPQLTEQRQKEKAEKRAASNAKDFTVE